MKNRLWIIAFMAFLILPVGAGYVYRTANPDEDRRQIEEEENRRMAEIEWDKLFDSCQSIDSWYNDRAPLRSPLMKLYQQVSGSAEHFFDDRIAAPLDRLINAGARDPQAGQDPDAEPTPDFDWATVFNPEDTDAPYEDPFEEPTETDPEPSGEEATENSSDDPDVSEPDDPSADETIPETEASGNETPAGETTAVSETSKAPETTKSPETTKAVVSNVTEAAPTQPAGNDPRKNHNLVAVQTVKPDYTHWGYTDYRCTDCGRTFRLDVKYKLVDSSQLSPRIVGSGVIVGRSGWYFYTGQRSVEYYKGQCLPTAQELTNYASVLKQIKARCDKLGIKLFVLIAPNKEQVYSEYMPTYSVATANKRAQRIVSHLQNQGITVLYPLAELKAGDLYHETYYRNDTHWTPYGAYIAASLIEKRLGMGPADPYSVDLPGTTKTIRNGDMVQLGNIPASNRPSIPYFVPNTNASISFTGEANTSNVRRTVSTNPNGKSLVLIGDSFRVNMSDTLAKDFKKTLILHRDYLSASMKNEILRTNVLILETVERYDVQFFAFLPNLLNILNMTPDPVQEPVPETTAAPTEPATTAAPTTAHEHSWDSGSVTKEASCTQPGEKTYKCACGESRTEEIPAAGHSWNAGAVTTEPTCTAPGIRTYTCSKCGETRTETIAAAGHSWNAGTVTKAAYRTDLYRTRRPYLHLFEVRGNSHRRDCGSRA